MKIYKNPTLSRYGELYHKKMQFKPPGIYMAWLRLFLKLEIPY